MRTRFQGTKNAGEEQTPEAEARIENIAELINSAYTYDEDEKLPLKDFLQNIALITDPWTAWTIKAV